MRSAVESGLWSQWSLDMSSAMSELSFTLLVDALRRRPVRNNVAPVFFRSAPNEKIVHLRLE